MAVVNIFWPSYLKVLLIFFFITFCQNFQYLKSLLILKFYFIQILTTEKSKHVSESVAQHHFARDKLCKKCLKENCSLPEISNRIYFIVAPKYKDTVMNISVYSCINNPEYYPFKNEQTFHEIILLF